ncbi:hypothetical protein N665_0052s0002 [Sinapis alba]|nr:hypothetical protein N665_0052s0002 [Sinapis alba]
MSNNVSIHFQSKDRMFSITMKTSVEDMTLSMIEERMYKKLGLDHHKEKLKMSYMPMVVGCERPLNIVDDEDLFVYLTSTDKENRRSILVVESSERLETVDTLSIVGKSYVGMNYKQLEPLKDEIGPNAKTLYVKKEHENNELIEGENADATT